MTRCPSCNATAAADARFCSKCGARLSQELLLRADQPAATSAAPEAPNIRDDNPMIRLGSASSAPTMRLPESAPTAQRPDEPSAPAGDQQALSSWRPSAAAGYAAPTAAYPLPQTTRLQPGAPVRNRPWLIIGLLAGLGLMTIVALVLGFALIMRDNRVAGLPIAAAAPTVRATPPSATEAAVAARDATLLRDTFDSAGESSLTEGENDTVTYAFVDGTYAITLKQPDYIVWSPFEGSYDDASAEVDVTLAGAKENAAGLIFRYQDDQNFYTFLISSDERYELELYHQDTLTTLIDWTESSAIKRPGVANHLRVETMGDRIRLFVNNKLLDEISDDSFGKGQMALAATTFGKSNVTVAFDNLVVRGAK
jgi:hypothetical protein